MKFLAKRNKNAANIVKKSQKKITVKIAEKNNQKVIHFVKKSATAKIPTKATPGAAGFDLYANIAENVTISPGDLAKIPTGIAISLPNKNYVALVFARSGLAVNHGITLSNGVGVVDSDYRGEIFVGLCNLGKKSYTIIPHERIAQIIIMPIVQFALLNVAQLDETIRGENGFGSTGRLN